MSSPSAGPTDEPRLRGVVQRLYSDRGFGFIRVTEGPDSGQEFFFHMSGLDGCHLDDLEEGLVVEFASRVTAKGKRAERVARVA